MINKITDVFFDLDHTLWDFDKNSALTFKIIFEKNNVVVDLERFSKIYQPINLKYCFFRSFLLREYFLVLVLLIPNKLEPKH